MDVKSLQAVAEGTPSDCQNVLANFNVVHEKSKEFCDIDAKRKQLLWDALFTRLKLRGNNPELIKSCLNTLRLLSREKIPLEQAITDDRIVTLLQISGLCSGEEEEEEEAQKDAVEGLKVTFNMVFQSPALRIMFISNGILLHLVKRIDDFTKSPKYSQEFQYFVLRILFLITALCQDTAPAKVRNIHNGLPIITSYLESNVYLITGPVFDPVVADIVCEVLKVLYNLIADLVPKNKRNESCEWEMDAEDLNQLKKITRITRILLLLPKHGDVEVVTKQEELKRHSIDLLAAVPSSCFEEFLVVLPTGELSEFILEEHDMSSVESVLKFLDLKLDDVKRSAVPPDNIAPPLLALHNMAISNRYIRKYLKKRILPPLKREDVQSLPEEGRTTRNKLVALLTSPITHITDLVANLLFVLCKEKVGKLVKYTGYGNAAGLLANRGLMLGGKPPPGKYSDSDVEDGSDTEEYQEVEHMINHIEGRIQLERPNPMEGMTDEQKEYEAMKLINAIDKMERFGGGIRPCRIGSDGRPVPIQHVLQLQEALENPIKGMRRDDETDSDSD